jgi:hypothetical protein
MMLSLVPLAWEVARVRLSDASINLEAQVLIPINYRSYWSMHISQCVIGEHRLGQPELNCV